MQNQKQSQIKYFAYVRKSSEGEERQALSIDSQKDKVKEFFANLDIVEILEERHSAFSPYSRPVFEEMIRRIKAGEAGGIIAWHPDRLSRNEIDASTITYLVRTGVIADLKFGSYNFDNSPEGIMMLQLALSQSQYFSSKLSKDVKRGLEKKLNMGWKPGVAPEGYLNDLTDEKGLRKIIKSPTNFPLVRKMWDLMLTGNYTPPQILKIANEEWDFRTTKRKKVGNRPLSRSGIYKIFTNLFYAGKFEYGGQIFQDVHEPMVSEAEFERVQILLGRKNKPKSHDRVFAFTGLIRCECGLPITAEAKNQIICSNCKTKFAYENKSQCPKCEIKIEEMKNPTILNYVYYHCTKTNKEHKCKQPSIEVKKLEKQIDKFLSSIQINQKYLDWAIKHLKKSHKLESKTQDNIISNQQKAYNQAKKQLDRLLEMRMNEEIEEQEYKTKKSQIINERNKYDQLLKEANQRQDKWLELSERTFNFARYASFWFQEGNLQKKREILATLGSNLSLKDKKLSIQAPEPFLIIQNGLKEIPEARNSFEPKKIPINKGKTGCLEYPLQKPG